MYCNHDPRQNPLALVFAHERDAPIKCSGCGRWMRRRPTKKTPLRRRPAPLAAYCIECPVLPFVTEEEELRFRPHPAPQRRRTRTAASLLLGLLALGLMGSSVQADSILPWRQQINQRLKDQQQLISNLMQQQRPAPQVQPSPPIIVQPLPVPGEPKQLLPIPGEPKQALQRICRKSRSSARLAELAKVPLRPGSGQHEAL